MTSGRSGIILDYSSTGAQKVTCVYFLPICYWKTVVLIEIKIYLRRYRLWL
nr:MAG TPA: hypothetical protein [Caudoviricetes sp.]